MPDQSVAAAQPRYSSLFRYLAAQGHLLFSLSAIFVAVLGSKLWLVSFAGNDVPFWDQWGGEGWLLYKPLLDKGVGAIDWLSAHNEHRILVSRITSVLLLFVNGQWDPIVQMCWEGVCAGAIAVGLCVIAARRALPISVPLLFVMSLLGTILPFGWENSLAGFQTPFYYMIFMSLTAFYLLSHPANLSMRRCFAIATLGALTLCTLASGALTCLAVACALIVRFIFGYTDDRRRVLGLSFLLLIFCMLGYGTTPIIAAHESLKAHTFGEWWTALWMVVGWPTQLGLLIWVPFASWAISVVVQRRINSAGLFLVALAAFVLLNAAAIALSRGANSSLSLASRYTDIAWMVWLVNLWSVVLLTNDARSDHRFWSIASRPLLVGFFAFASASLLGAGWDALPDISYRKEMYAMEAGNTRIYVTTGDFNALANKPPLQIPYPDAGFLRMELDDPTIRGILPPGIRAGIFQRSQTIPGPIKASGLVLTGVPYGSPPAPPPWNGYFYGTYGAAGNKTTARFVGPTIHAQGTFVRVLVSGYLGRPGLALYLEDVAGGTRSYLTPKRIAGNSWQAVRAKLPGDDYRLVAEDSAVDENGWFAFTDPVELGRVRPLADFATQQGAKLTIYGVLAFFAMAIAVPFSQRRALA